jgi:serine protease Do
MSKIPIECVFWNQIGPVARQSRYLDQGEKLTFVGNPYDMQNITTWGRVANSKIVATGPWGGVNTVNGDIDPGMSGGPVYDRGHNVVGINVGTIEGSGLGWIVPGRVICGLMGTR